MYYFRILSRITLAFIFITLIIQLSRNDQVLNRFQIKTQIIHGIFRSTFAPVVKTKRTEWITIHKGLCCILTSGYTTPFAIRLLSHHNRRNQNKIGNPWSAVFCIGTITNILHSGFQSQPFGDITLKVKIQIITIVSNPRHEIIIKYIAHTAKETYFLTASAKVQRMLGSQHMFVQYQISPIRIWIVIGIAAISKPSDFFIRISLIFSS